MAYDSYESKLAFDYPPVIPPPNSINGGKNLILCFDGTGDQFDADNSNIVQLVSLLKKDDARKQLVYYQAGIGTYTTSPGFMTAIQKTFDEMVAWSIDAHVMAGYEFLMQNCKVKFSNVKDGRPTELVRSFGRQDMLICLAGMLYKVGLLTAGNLQQIPFAYKMYTLKDKIGWKQSKAFKKAFSVDVTIEFLGVWDTVSSLGIISKSLPVATANTLTRTFRHAISLDERRAKFQPHFWHLPLKEKSELDILIDQHTPASVDTDVEEVWFSGCHSDVGGGAVSNKTRHSLARIPLRWMVRESFKTSTGIMFNSDSLFDIGLDPSTLYPYVKPRPASLPIGSHRIQNPPTKPIPMHSHALLVKKGRKLNILQHTKTPFSGTEEQEELQDALSPKYDQLKRVKAWWALEIIPLLQVFQRSRESDDYIKAFRPHLGLPRFIPHQRSNGFKVHRSVQLRMNAEFEDERARKRGKKYIPKTEFHVEPTWVD